MAITPSGSRRSHIILVAVVSGWLTALACGGDGQNQGSGGSGGTTVSSGGSALGGAATGGDSFGAGGVQTTGGWSTGGQPTGGLSSGGVGTGGQVTGGAGTGGVSTGGMATGGTATGGTATGGTASGGLPTGGTGTGGRATGGVGTGGRATGGTETGGVGTGGVATGGTSTGGTATGGRSTGGTTSTGGTSTGGAGGSTCVPYHFAGTDCASCHGASCTCETQYTNCLMRVCASPDTPIATPSGTRPIASLAVGDMVFSVDHGEVAAVPVRRVRRAHAGLGHRVVRVVLATGSVLEISAPHPTADGRKFGELRTGGRLGGVEMVDVEMVPYRHAFTYDILPASDSGTYFAGGVLIGSTLAAFPDMAMWESAAALTPGAVPSASCEERCTSRWAFGGW